MRSAGQIDREGWLGEHQAAIEDIRGRVQS